MLKRLFKDESGQGMVEYGLIIALVAIVIIAALGVMSGSLKGMFQGVGTTVGGISTTS